jgi:hypothetical protein
MTAVTIGVMVAAMTRGGAMAIMAQVTVMAPTRNRYPAIAAVIAVMIRLVNMVMAGAAALTTAPAIVVDGRAKDLVMAMAVVPDSAWAVAIRSPDLRAMEKIGVTIVIMAPVTTGVADPASAWAVVTRTVTNRAMEEIEVTTVVMVPVTIQAVVPALVLVVADLSGE